MDYGWSQGLFCSVCPLNKKGRYSYHSLAFPFVVVLALKAIKFQTQFDLPLIVMFFIVLVFQREKKLKVKLQVI